VPWTSARSTQRRLSTSASTETRSRALSQPPWGRRLPRERYVLAGAGASETTIAARWDAGRATALESGFPMDASAIHQPWHAQVGREPPLRDAVDRLPRLPERLTLHRDGLRCGGRGPILEDIEHSDPSHPSRR
jgi:hypothetical protein